MTIAPDDAARAADAEFRRSGTAYTLRDGCVYVVQESFTDHYGDRFERGERLTFRHRHFLPYHGGHTLAFAERAIFLQDDENYDMINHLWRYLQPVSA